MITPAYGMTATERVLPRLALDFTTGTLDPRVTVMRALNTATRVNSSGLIENVNADLPRFDYDPVTLAPKGLLIEEARTNPILQSAAFNAANYGKVASSVTPNVETAPDGALLADEFIVDGTTGIHYLQQANTGMVSGSTYTWSVYAKANTMPYLVLSLYNTTSNNYACASFDLATNTVANTAVAGTGISLSSSSAINSGNGWYRYIITAVAGTNAFNRCGIGMSLDGTVAGPSGFPSFVGDGASSFYLWGAQLETGAFATSYIPTTTTSVTRNADVVSMTGTNFSDWYNASEGAIAVTLQSLPNSGAAIFRAVCINDGTVNNSLIFAWTVSTTTMRSRLVVGGATQFQFSGTVNPTDENTICTTYKENSFAASFNGAASLTDGAGVLSTPNQLAISGDGTGTTNVYCGHIKKILYWPQRITDAESQAFAK